MKPIVLIIVHHYLPGTKSGGPVRTISNLVEQLGDDFDFRILTTDRDHRDLAPYPDIESGVWYPVGKAHVRYLSRAEQKLWHLRRILAGTQYDLLYLNGTYNTTTIATLLLRRLGLIGGKPVLLAPRGHLETGALSLKPRKKRIFLTAAKLVGLFANLSWHAASTNERDDVLREFGQGEQPRIHVVQNLVAASPTDVIAIPVPKQAGTLRVVFLSRISRKKNLDFALRALAPLQGEVHFDIYGPAEDPAYWDECQSLIAALRPNVRVNYRGMVAPAEVVSTLAHYHLLLFPTLGENFGHIIAEALLAGCPVLISDRTPWQDVESQQAGWVLPLAAPENFTQRLQQLVDMDAHQFEPFQHGAAAYDARIRANADDRAAMHVLLMALADKQ